jgi:hypothetical protein
MRLPCGAARCRLQNLVDFPRAEQDNASCNQESLKDAHLEPRIAPKPLRPGVQAGGHGKTALRNAAPLETQE